MMQQQRPRASKRGMIVALSIVVILLSCCAIGLVSVLEQQSRSTPAPGPTNVTTTGTPRRTPAASVTPVPIRTAAAQPTYAALSHRTWLKVSKAPDSYRSKTYVVYGVITQFDTATGTDAFRADVDGVKHAEGYEYPTNTMLNGATGSLADFVEGDQFTAWVSVAGSYNYDTQIGGSTTVPLLNVERITRR